MAGIELEAAFEDASDGVIQNSPDRMALPAVSGAIEAEATRAAGSGLTCVFGRKPAGGRYAGCSGPPKYRRLMLLTLR